MVEFRPTGMSYIYYKCRNGPKTWSTPDSIGTLILCLKKEKMVRMMVMVLNATFNNISVISWRSVLLVAESGVSGENQNSNSQVRGIGL
jgi:hypothetical protein